MVALAAVLTTAVALRLLAGPIDIDFLRNRIGQEFETPAGKMRVHADRVFVEWSSLGQPMRLVLSGLRVTNSAEHVVATARSLAPGDHIFVVVGHQGEQVRQLVAAQGVRFIEQREQKGTGHAVLAGRQDLQLKQWP